MRTDGQNKEEKEEQEKVGPVKEGKKVEQRKRGKERDKDACK